MAEDVLKCCKNGLMLINYSKSGSGKRTVFCRMRKRKPVSKKKPSQFGLSDTLAAANQKIKTLSEVEKEHINYVLETCGGRKGEAAKLLGIDRKTLFRKLKEFASRQNS